MNETNTEDFIREIIRSDVEKGLSEVSRTRRLGKARLDGVLGGALEEVWHAADLAGR